ncbi:MAG: M1 family aminopeptidase, partial [Bellilinea sp.]
VPAAWQVASSGREVSRASSNNDAVIQIAGGPLREFMLAASPTFELERTLWEDITINHWGQPESESSRAEVMQAAVEALSLFSQTFGPLPYNELDIIAAPLNNASGVEYPGLILVGESLYNSRSLPHILPMATAHEIAHQWWYAVVGNDVLQHPWLDESLATYSAQLYLLNHDPVFYRGALREFRKQVTDLEAEIGVQPLDQSVADLSNLERAYAIVAYLKGNLFFEALREEIGAAEFNAALQAYYRENSYQIASPADLLESFEFACTCDLNELFSEWGVQP